MNALYLDEKLEVQDFQGGIADIRSKLLKFVGNPKRRIQEDYLRILRFFRFWGQTGFEVDEKSLKACVKNIDGCQNLSGERVTSEVLKLLTTKHTKKPSKHLLDAGLWEKITHTPTTLDQNNFEWA